MAGVREMCIVSSQSQRLRVEGRRQANTQHPRTDASGPPEDALGCLTSSLKVSYSKRRDRRTPGYAGTYLMVSHVVGVASWGLLINQRAQLWWQQKDACSVLRHQAFLMLRPIVCSHGPHSAE